MKSRQMVWRWGSHKRKGERDGWEKRKIAEGDNEGKREE